MTLFLNISFGNISSRCDEVYQWIYKDLALNNLQDSMKLTELKIMLAVLTSLKNSKNLKLSQNRELLKHYKSLESNSKNFAKVTQNYSPLKSFKFWRPWGYHKTETLNLSDAMKSWRLLQKEKPLLFKGLSKEYKISKWDIFLAKKMRDIFKFNIEDENLAQSLKNLHSHHNNKKKYQLETIDISKIKRQIKGIQRKVLFKLKNDFHYYGNKFKNLCHEDKALYTKGCKVLNNTKLNINSKLNHFSDVLEELNHSSKKPEVDSVDLLNINSVDYEKSKNRKAVYCKRDPKALSSITIHHTGTKTKWTPQDINRFHLNRSTSGNPWYMIGYHYLISGKNKKVYNARPLEYRGAHAGGFEKDISKAEYERIKDIKMTCAHTEKEHHQQGAKTLKNRFEKSKKLSGNITSVGIAVIGNYAKETPYTVAGVELLQEQVISYLDQDIIKKIAKLSCKLQRKYPNIKKLRPHSYYANTSCPGVIKKLMGKIASMANSYGCNFKVEIN